MKKLLSYGGAALITAALLDPIICSGLGKPLPWLRDILMGAGGVACASAARNRSVAPAGSSRPRIRNGRYPEPASA